MKPNVSSPSILVVAAAAACFFPRPASAFSQRCESEVVAPEDADGYEALALASLNDRESWPYIARMLEKSASLRDKCDVRAVTALVLAARIYHHLGRVEMARLVFVQAAERAWIAGELSLAAQCYLDASVIAVDQNHQEAAVETAMKVDLLRSSSRLEESDREAIRRRLMDRRVRAASSARSDVTRGDSGDK